MFDIQTEMLRAQRAASTLALIKNRDIQDSERVKPEQFSAFVDIHRDEGQGATLSPVWHWIQFLGLES